MAKCIKTIGQVWTIDLDIRSQKIAKKYWAKEGLTNINPILNIADIALKNLLEQEQKNNFFDLIFIDADKVNYPIYYEYSLKLLKKGGLIIFDNMFWKGRVTDPEYLNKDKDTQAIDSLNKQILCNPAHASFLCPIGDGLLCVTSN